MSYNLFAHFIHFSLVYLTLVTFYKKSSCYETYYIEELCSRGKMQIYLSHNGSSSAGILSATRHLSYSLHMQCVIRLQAPPGHNVVVSLRDIGFRVLPDGECKDFIKIQEEPTVEGNIICQRVRNLDEARSYFTSGDKNFVEIIYSTASDLNNKSMTGYPGVTLIFTAFYYDSSGSCSEDDEFTCENKRCIWKGLACDGHNNCGDLSDENTYGISNCGYIGGGSMTFVILAVVIVVLAFLVALATLVCYKGRERRRRHIRSKRRTQSTVAILAIQDPSRRGHREGKEVGRMQKDRRCFSLYSTFKSPEASEESAAAERSTMEMEANAASNSLSRS